MTTLFTNGALFDGHRYVGRGSVVVEGGRVLSVVPDHAGAVAGLGSDVEVVDLTRKRGNLLGSIMGRRPA